MKRIFSKNRVIALLIGSNVGFGCMIFAKDIDVRTLWSKWFPAKTAEKQASKIKRAQVSGGDPKYDSEIQACYEDFLVRAPSVEEGAVILRWTQNEQGVIESLALVRSEVGDQPFTDCLIETVKHTRFPASVERAGVLISHKFNFRRKDPGHIEFE